MRTFTSAEVLDFWKTSVNLERGKAPLQEYENAIVVPISPTRSICYDADGNIIPSSLIVRGAPGGDINAQHPVPGKIYEKDSGAFPFIDEEIYFVGYINKGHWGHFLTESLARCYHLDGPSMKVVSAGDMWMVKDLFPQHQYIVENKPFKVRKLLLPYPTMADCAYILPEQIDTCRKLALLNNVEPIKNKKVYLSRTKVNKLRGRARWTEGETELEGMLKKDNWSIYHFQDLPLREQIGVLEGAELVVGCIGSAFHNLMLTRNNPGQVVYLTNPVSNPNYAHHDAILGNESIYVDCQDVIDKQLRVKKIRDPHKLFEYLSQL
jgi:capsular polysaccharide biosynthesis protein